MTQLIKCTPWSMRLCAHPTIVKKVRTFLEVEGKMGPTPQPTSSQYGPPQPDMNPNVRKDKATEKEEKSSCLPRDLGLTQSPSLVKQLCTHLQLFPRPQPVSNLKHNKEQIIDLHP